MDWGKVVAYAHKYACNTASGANGKCYNSAYLSFGADCTNFVSQALYAGGMPMERHSTIEYWKSEWFYDKSNDKHAKAWTSVQYFQDYFKNAKSYGTWIRASSMGAQYTPAARGDIYMYNWGRGEGWSHLAIETGFGQFADFVDHSTGRRYRSVTSGSGDYISQHVTDRDYSPWNWGYQTETNPKYRRAMDTIILHWNR